MELHNCPCSGKNSARLVHPAVMAGLAAEPIHGYLILQRPFRDAHSSAAAARPDGRYYRVLKAMEQEVWLGRPLEATDNRPAKRCFALTASGRKCLARWGGTLPRLRGIHLRPVNHHYAREAQPVEVSPRSLRGGPPNVHEERAAAGAHRRSDTAHSSWCSSAPARSTWRSSPVHLQASSRSPSYGVLPSPLAIYATSAISGTHINPAMTNRPLGLAGISAKPRSSPTFSRNLVGAFPGVGIAACAILRRIGGLRA